MVSALGAGHLEVDLSLLKFLFVGIYFSGYFFEKVNYVLTYFVHSVVEVLHVLHRMGDKGLCFLLPPVYCGLCSFIYNHLECLAFFQLSVVLLQEVLQVVEHNVSVFVGVLHVFSKLLYKLIEYRLGIFVYLFQVVVNCRYVLLRQVRDLGLF